MMWGIIYVMLVVRFFALFSFLLFFLFFEWEGLGGPQMQCRCLAIMPRRFYAFVSSPRAKQQQPVFTVPQTRLSYRYLPIKLLLSYLTSCPNPNASDPYASHSFSFFSFRGDWIPWSFRTLFITLFSSQFFLFFPPNLIYDTWALTAKNCYYRPILQITWHPPSKLYEKDGDQASEEGPCRWWCY